MQKVIPFWENVGGENPSIFIVEFVQIIKMLIIYSFFFAKQNFQYISLSLVIST